MRLLRRPFFTNPLRYAWYLGFVVLVLLPLTAQGQNLMGSKISGRLIVPPDVTRETEPNDTIADAQEVSSTVTVIGRASQTDPGMMHPFKNEVAKFVDLFRIQPLEPTRVILTLAANNLFENDLDLILLDLDGQVLDRSEGYVSTEVLDLPPGEFILAIRAFRGVSAYQLVAQAASADSASRVPTMLSTAPFRAGEIIVKRKPNNIDSEPEATHFAKSYGFNQAATTPHLESLWRPADRVITDVASSSTASKFDYPDSPMQRLKALTLDTVRRLQRDPEVVYAEPNYLQQAWRVPNDELYSRQWHYDLINLPEAWDVTIGSSDVIVAILDTGVLLAHPELRGRLIDGYDFISDPVLSRDGDGPDPNANDPGDDPKGQNSTFHGTHVAGIIGATTDNHAGVAGVTWQTRLMPLRVLGADGGTVFDISQAIRYAAGLPNISETVPSKRADIINLSLGGPGYSQSQQDAIQAARDEGVLVVAAAGNQNSGGFFSPPSLAGVISVSAVDMQTAKAPYSNFGHRIDVAAPGGNTHVDLNHDAVVDGVLSTLGTDEGTYGFELYQGTSMAAPHVSGVLALMLAVNPTLTPDAFDQLLAGTHPYTSQRLTRDLGAPGHDDIFGHGLIDAAAAVQVAADLLNRRPPSQTGSILSLSTRSLTFGTVEDQLQLDITNAGGDDLHIISISANVPWLSVDPSDGQAPLNVTVQLDRAALGPGYHQGTLTVTSDATRGDPTAVISIQAVSGVASLGDAGPISVIAVDPISSRVQAYALTTPQQNYAYTLAPLAAGRYVIVAGTDLDHDFLICDLEDLCGFFPDVISLFDAAEVTGVNILVDVLSSLQLAPSTVVPAIRSPFQRLD